MGAYEMGLDVLGGRGGHGGGGRHGGGGGHGGGHGGGRHHGGRGGFRTGPGWGGGWGGWGLDVPYGYYLVDEPTEDCDFYGPNGECYMRVSEVLGAFDIQGRQREMNTLKLVPVSVANALLRTGQQVIDQARSVGKTKNLPGTTTRDNVYWKLKWHAEALKGKAPDSIYELGEDLKKWTMQAFIEANAAEEGAAHTDAAWSAMWTEIGLAIMALPKNIASTVLETTGLGSLMKWIIGIAVVGAALGVGYVYMIHKEEKSGR